MKHKAFYTLIVSVGLVLFGGSNLSAQPVDRSGQLSRIIESSTASHALWSIAVRDTSGRLLLKHNHDQLVRPASNIKLLTSAAVLDALGEEYSYKTFLYGVGTREGDAWKGDIVVRGSGDPSISGTYYGGDRFHVFEKFYAKLDSMGIRRISGNLIGNDSFFDQQPYPKGWSWDDLSFYYGVEISALSFNNNAVDLQVFGDGKIGSTPEIQWFPFDTDYVEFVNEQTIVPPNLEYDEYYRRVLGTNTIVLRSKIPQHYYEEESLSVMNASLFFLDTFKKYLEDGGIEVGGRVFTDEQPRNWGGGRYTVLAVHESVPLKKLLIQVNRESDNFYTEMLLKTAAAESFDAQGSTELGISLVKEFAHGMELDTTRIEMTDGSGMSPATLVSTGDISRLLVKMQHHPAFGTYRNSLAIGGINGSLENRFGGTALINRVRAKTGYVSGVRSLSGYIESSSDRRLIFSIATNHYTDKTSYIDALHDSILKLIYETY